MSIRFALAAVLALGPVVHAQESGERAAAPTLKAGQPAPALAVESWVKGGPIAGFEQGKVYVMEFWATWCGPCIASMPHLSSIQADYADKGVTVIGTNIWEDKEYSPATLEKVSSFVGKQGDRMAYTVAFDGAAKAMDASYMKAAGADGIPTAFIVGRDGTIAWIGHPMEIDYPLSEVVAGTWDPVGGPERAEKVMGELAKIRSRMKADAAGAQADFTKFEAAYPAIARHQDDLRLQLLRANGHWEEADAVVAREIDEAIARQDANTLNQLAWDIVDPEAAVARRNLELAMKAALKADELSGGKNANTIDTVARCYAWNGDFAKAVELQTRAVELAPEGAKASLQATLDEYKAKAAAK